MRYKEYNVNKVLEQAIVMFWQKGFNGCSVNDLVSETGVNRFSLYHEFENKEGILYSSLKLYQDRHCDDKLAILKSDGNLIDILKKFYLSFFSSKPNHIPGCYFVHIGTELADSDLRVKKLVDNYLDEVLQLLVKLLKKNNYEDTDAKYLARHLLGLYCTSMSFCLIHTEKEREQYVSNVLNVILKNYA